MAHPPLTLTPCDHPTLFIEVSGGGVLRSSPRHFLSPVDFVTLWNRSSCKCGCDRRDKRTDSGSRRDERPWGSPPRLVAVGALLGVDDAKPPPLGPKPLPPAHLRLRLLAHQYDCRDRRDRGRSCSLPPPREPRGLARVPVQLGHQHELLQLRVRHLRPAGTTPLASGGRSAGLDLVLDIVCHGRRPGVLTTAVPHRTVAELALEVGGVADLGGDSNRDDLLRVLVWAARRSRPDPKPARDGGLFRRLRRGSIDYVPPPVPRGGLIAVRATAPSCRGRAPAAQMARLRRRDASCRYHPYHYPRSDRHHPGSSGLGWRSS